MKRKYIYACIIASLITACTSESFITPDTSPENKSALLQIHATAQSSGKFVPFEKGDKIRLYFAYEELNQVPWWHQGVYTFPDNGSTTNDKWDFTSMVEGNEKDASIYRKHITKGNDGQQYYFTATSLPEPFVGKDSSRYQVLADQTRGIKSSDFIIARGVCKDDKWKDDGLHLHFRHVLSQLVVKVILPQGSEADGFFPDPKDKNMTCTADILNRQLDYTVTYNKEKGDGAILDIDRNTGKVITSSIKMYKIAEATDTTTASGGPAAYHTFRAILPSQGINKSETLISFAINNKKYSYAPPESNTIMLAQEKITTVILTVLSGASSSKVELNNVTINDWNTDKANIGEVIPQNN